MKPHEVKRIQAEQLEANENERLMTPTERKKRRKAKQRHSQLKIVSGSAAGALNSPLKSLGTRLRSLGADSAMGSIIV